MRIMSSKKLRKNIVLVAVTVLAVLLISVSCESHVHEWTETVETAPGCETEGLLVRTCACGAKEEEKIPATGHKEPVTQVVKAPTCTEKGISSKVCPACKKTLSTFETPAKGHTLGTASVTKAPTCTETGLEETICTVCNAKTGSRTIAALGHDWGDPQIEKDSTCTETGTAKRTCKRENCKETAIGIIAKKAHSFTCEPEVKSEATCTEKGVTTIKCANCDAVQESYTDALGHNFSGETIDTLSATCTESGKKKTECTRCTEVQETIIPALGHDFNIDQGWKKDTDGTTTKYEATEFSKGIKVYKCSRCEETEEREEWGDVEHHEHETIEAVGGWDAAYNTLFSRYLDTENRYGKNTAATCAVDGIVYAYCNCYQDTEGNFCVIKKDENTEAPISEEGLTRYSIGQCYLDRKEGYYYYLTKNDAGDEVKNKIDYYGTVSKDNLPKHGSTVDTKTEIDSYIYGSYTTSKCTVCGDEVGDKVYSKEGKKSAEGRWTGNVAIENGDYSMSMDSDISLYPNGISIFKNIASVGDSGKVDYFELLAEYNELGPSDYEDLYRTTDGRWVSIVWAVDEEQVYSELGEVYYPVKYFGFASESYDSYRTFYVLSEYAEKEEINCDVFGNSDNPLVLTREELATGEKSVLTISDVADLTKITFSEDAGVDTVTIPTGNDSVTLKCFSLTAESLSTCTWAKDGTTVSATSSIDTYKLEKTASGSTIACTVGTEIHTVKVIFAE